MGTKLYSLVAIAMLCLMSPGCGSSNTLKNEDQEKTINIEVTNYNWSDAVVYLHHAFSPLMRIRIGEVPSMSVRNFDVPREYINDLKEFALFVHLIGKDSKSYTSGIIQAQNVQTIELTIQEHIAYSSTIVK